MIAEDLYSYGDSDSNDDESYYTDYRLLQDNTTNSNNSTTSDVYNDSEVLRATFVVYGSVLIGAFLLFCYLRRKFPRPYNLRNWVDHLKTPIAKHQYGFLSWMWQLNAVTEDEILNECGMDALCFLRLLRMGYKIAVMSCFNAIWLMPLYATAETDSKTAQITDRVVKLSIAHVPEGSPRCVGTVLAAYVLFGYLMYLILQEFDWFIEKRHKYLKKPRAQNYSVYVRNIPDEYKSNADLEDYFRSCFSDKAVLEARLRIKAPALAAAAAQRDKLVTQLEHALNYEEVKGETPRHKSGLVAGAMVDSIPTYANDLKEANDDVTKRITEIENKIESKAASKNVEKSKKNGGSNMMLHSLYQGSMYGLSNNKMTNRSTELMDDSDSEIHPLEISALTHDQDDIVDAPTEESNSKEEPDQSNHSSNNILGQGVNVLSSTTKKLSSTTKKLAEGARSFITQTEEGDFYNAGFVTFSSLRTTSAALQMIHHDKPFNVEVQEAPRPEDSKLVRSCYKYSPPQSYKHSLTQHPSDIIIESLLDERR